MGIFLLRRLIYSVIVIWGVVTIVFALQHITGDPAGLMAPPDATAADIEEIRIRMGFDRPFHVQYLDFIASAARGDFGQSLRARTSALRLVVERLPATLELTAFAMVVSIIIAVPIGVLSAVRRGSFIDLGGMVMALIGQSAPTFWLGLMLIMVFSLRLNWLPPSGRGGIEELIMPGITLGAYSVAIITRVLRSSMLDILAADYIRMARAKGLAERNVLIRHALRNASMPVVTIIGLQIGILFGGAVITEYVFAYPGVGRLVLQSIEQRDYPVVQAFVVVLAVAILLTNLLTDLVYFILDPRLKISE